MPRLVFSDELEKKLIELWAEYQRTKSGQMKKRAVKEREMTAAINTYAKELYGADSPEFSQTVIHNKIDNLKSKARGHYRKYRKETGTGQAVDDPGSDNAYDLELAYANWGNFKVWHHCFREVPGYGPLQSLNTATISSVSVPISQVQSAEPPQSSPRTSDHLPIQLLPVARPPMSNVDSDDDLDLLMAGLGGETIVESPSVPQAPAPTSAAGAVTPTTIYVPGTHGKRKNSQQKASVTDFNDDSDSDSFSDEEPKKPPPKKKPRKARNGDGVSNSDVMAITDRLIAGIGEIQTEQQKNMQTFTSGLMAQQALNTQALVQSQMSFMKQLFDSDAKK